MTCRNTSTPKQRTRWWGKAALLGAAFALGMDVQAQTANTYLFTTSTGNALDPMTGAATVLTTGNDDSPSVLQTLPFTFNYVGTAYTQYSLTPDGFLKFGSPAAIAQFSNLVTSTTNIPKIFPYWDDMATGTTGNVRSVTVGTTPNRIHIVQWFVTIPRNTAGAANSTFQAWLYETTNVVEFRYGTMGAATMSASVGINGPAATNFHSITVSANTTSTVTANNTNAGQPASGRMYRFVPCVGSVSVSASPVGPFCAAANTTLTASGADTYVWSPATGLSSTTGNPVTATPTATTTYTVTGTITATGCQFSNTVTVTVNPNPPISSVTATPNPICVNGSSQLLASAVQYNTGPVNTYTFAASAGASLDPMTGATTVLTTGNDDTPGTLQPIGFTFNYNGTNVTQWSCTPDGFMRMGSTIALAQFTNSVTSTTNIPLLYPYWDDVATGTTGNVRSLVTGTAPNRILKVQWFVTIPRNTAGPANSTFQAWLYETTNIIEFRYGTMGAAAMGASVGLTGGATNFHSATIATNTSSTVTANDLNAGQPASGTMYRYSPPQAALTYAWSPSTFLNNPSIANPMATGVTGTTPYTVTVTNPGTGCFSTGNITVTVNPSLSGGSTITPASPAFCTGGSVLLTANPGGGGGPFTYQWTDPNSNLAGTSQTQSANIAGLWSVAIQDACAGSDNASITVVQNPNPTVTVSPTSATYCTPGPAIVLTASGASTYAWGPAAGLSATTGNPVTATPATATTYTVTGTDGNGCMGTAQSVISIGSTPSIASTTATPSTICSNGTSQLQVSLTPPAAYCAAGQTLGTCAADEWISNITFGAINNTTPCNLPIGYNNHTGLSTGLVAGSVGNALSLSISQFLAGDQLRVWFDWNQNGLFTDAGEEYQPTGAVVAGANAFSISVPANALNGATRMRARLTFTGPIPPCGNTQYGETEDYTVNISGGASYSYSWDNAGTLNNAAIANPVSSADNTTNYTATVSLGGCSSTGMVTLTVNPEATADANGPYATCDGVPASIAATTNGTGTWSGGAGSFANATSASTTYTPTAGEAGTTVTLTWTTSDPDGAGPCGALADNASLVVNTLPVVTCGGPYGPVCTDAADITLTGAPSGGTWTGTGVTGNTFDPSAGTQTLTYTYTDGNTCVNSCMTTITVNPLPVVTCGSYGPVCITDPDVALGGSPAGGTWSGTGVTGNNFDPNAGTQTLTYTYTDGNSCTNSCMTTIVVVNTCNDLCVNAVALSCNSVTTGSTVGTNPDAVPTCGTSLNTAGGVWFTVVGTGGNITASLCGSSYDSQIGVFTTPDCSSFTCVAGNNNFCGLNGEVTFLSTLSQTYHILVTGFGTFTGAFTLEVVCAGNDPVTCLDNGVVLDIHTDNFGSETSWEIVPAGNTVPVCSGSGYPSNANITEECCLLTGCYVLSFFDSFNDGMCCVNGTGGYVLSTDGGDRIIDNEDDGQFTSVSSVANGFCVPIGNIQLTVATCDKEDFLINDVVVSGIDPLVSGQFGVTNATSGYQFWLFDPDGTYSRRLFRSHANGSCIGTPTGPTRAAHMKFSCLNSSLPNVPLNVMLNMRVRPRVAGNYGEFGPACRVMVLSAPPACPTTKLDDNPLHAGTTLSCGVTGKVVGVGGNTGKLFPNIVPGANKYQYEFYHAGESYTRTIATPTGSYALTLANWITSPLLCGTNTYAVRVRASFDGGATYCAYGDVCMVGITNNPPNNCTMTFQGGGGTSSILADDAGMSLWPNPTRNGNVTLALNGLSNEVMTATIDMFDVFGKKVSTNTLATDGAEALTTVLELKDLATGMYTVNVTSGSQTFTSRLVVE